MRNRVEIKKCDQEVEEAERQNLGLFGIALKWPWHGCVFVCNFFHISTCSSCRGQHADANRPNWSIPPFLSFFWSFQQEAQLSPSDRAMRLVSSNVANYHATVQKLLIRQLLTKPMVWTWRFWLEAMCHKPTTVELCISPVYRRLAVAKFSKSTM